MIATPTIERTERFFHCYFQNDSTIQWQLRYYSPIIVCSVSWVRQSREEVLAYLFASNGRTGFDLYREIQR